jgi:sugar phosphate isomerase/epimerase
LCNKCGETANRHGLKLAYHNHDFEFKKIDGIVPYDILLNEIDPNLMDFEIDLYWTRKGGVEALDYFKKYPGRFPLWHVKDMEKSEDQFFTEVGNGVIDWKKYFHKASEAGMRHFYVEQDQCKNYLPMKSVEMSIDYLKKLEI